MSIHPQFTQICPIDCNTNFNHEIGNQTVKDRTKIYIKLNKFIRSNNRSRDYMKKKAVIMKPTASITTARDGYKATGTGLEIGFDA